VHQPVQQPGSESAVPAGEATGPAREYQVECRDLLVQRVGSLRPLEPYAGEGIDVPILLGYATHKFDVALRGPDGRLVVAECKRWTTKKVSQGHVAEFADWVRRLAPVTDSPVAAFFMVTKDPQLGLLQTAFEPTVRVVVFGPDQHSPDLAFSFVRYDPITGLPWKDAVSYAHGSIGMRAMSSGIRGPAAPESSPI
jgi:hypothetical protein